MIQRTAANAVRPRHQSPHINSSRIPTSESDDNSSTAEGRLHKRPASMRLLWWRRWFRLSVLAKLFLFGTIVFLIHFALLIMISNRHKRTNSSFPTTSMWSRIQNDAADPMQPFLSPRKPQAAQAQHANVRDSKQEQERRQEQESSASAAPVGTFQGLPVSFHEAGSERIYSSVHCVGENFRPDTAWMVRSCEFRNLCFDLSTNDFVIFQSPEEQRLQQSLDKHRRRHQQRQAAQCKVQHQQEQQQGAVNSNGSCQVDPNLVTISTLAQHNVTKVALGSLNPLWGSSMKRLEWFPTIVPHSMQPGQGYYQLPDDVVWVPFHSSSSPGKAENLFWNDLFPIYTLLSMFDLIREEDDHDYSHNHNRLLLMRQVLDQPLLGTCDVDSDNADQCRNLFDKFLPVMGMDSPPQFSTNRDYQFTLFQNQQQQPQSNLICAKYGAAGIGMLSSKMNSGDTSHYKLTHNIGRGATLRTFSNFMARNLGILKNDKDGSETASFSLPFKVMLSVASTRHCLRDVDYTAHIARIHKEFSDRVNDGDVLVQVVDTQDLTLAAQARIVTNSAIFVSVCGDDSISATFLSPGASLIIHDDEQGDGGGTNKQAYWHLLRTAGYFRTHWLPLRTTDQDRNIAPLVDLVLQELNRIRVESRAVSLAR